MALVDQICTSFNAGLVQVGYHYRDDIQGSSRGYPNEHDTSPAMQHPTESGWAEWIRFPN